MTVPTPWSMVALVAPVVVQSSVVLIPGPTVAGLAKKAVIDGGPAGTTVAVAVAVDVPKALVAVNTYVVVAAGLSVTEVPATGPKPGFNTRLGEPVTAQLRVVEYPTVSFAGVAEKPVMVGRLPTITEAVAVTDPKLLVAVRVKEVVVKGVTFTDIPVTAPTPGLTLSPVEPVTAQLSTLDCPGLTFAGVAVKLAMLGALPAMTVTETTAVTDPKVFVAVRLYNCVAAGVTFADVPASVPT